MKKYQIIYADPPWPVDMVRFGEDKGKRFTHYPVMKVEDICKMKFDFFDTQAVIFMWATHTFLHDAFHVMQAWGFKYHSCVTWAKDGGMVNWGFHRSTEFLLYGYSGACPRSALSGKAFPCLVSAERGRHSEKPSLFRELISSKFSGNKIELFARQRVEGWDAWGDEINPDAPAENQGAEPVHLTTAPCQNNSNSRNYFSYKAITSA